MNPLLGDRKIEERGNSKHFTVLQINNLSVVDQEDRWHQLQVDPSSGFDAPDLSCCAPHGTMQLTELLRTTVIQRSCSTFDSRAFSMPSKKERRKNFDSESNKEHQRIAIAELVEAWFSSETSLLRKVFFSLSKSLLWNLCKEVWDSDLEKLGESELLGEDLKAKDVAVGELAKLDPLED